MKVLGGIAVLAVVAGLVLLASERGRAPEGDGGFVIRGGLRDAETGGEVSRQTFYLHFFCDEIDHQLSLDPAPASSFAVRMPEATVRIRAYDRSRAYHLYEETVTVPVDGLTRDLRLEPTGYVRLYGKIIEGATGKPFVHPSTPTIGGIPIVCFSAEGHQADDVTPAEDGSYSVRLPRIVLQVLTLDTPCSARPSQLDLSGVTGPEFEYDIVLE